MIKRIPDKEDIIDSARRIKEYIHHTPVCTSVSINRIAGCRLIFKCENLQKIGAFKARGACNTVLLMSENQRKNGIATHSSGNHAQAIAYAAGILGIKAYVVMPENAPKVKVNAVRGYGAEIIFCEPTLAARERELEKVLSETSAYFIHPYNDYNVIAGQATAAKELIEKIENSVLDAILTPVGGGGLLSGTCLSAKYFSTSTEVYAAEPEGAKDAWLSLKRGEIVPSVNPDTIADGLLTSLGDKTFPIIREHVKDILLVSDEEIINSMKLIWERMKLVVEPSAAVPLAAVLKNPDIFQDKQIGIILSGGNVDISKLPF